MMATFLKCTTFLSANHTSQFPNLSLSILNFLSHTLLNGSFVPHFCLHCTLLTHYLQYMTKHLNFLPTQSVPHSRNCFLPSPVAITSPWLYISHHVQCCTTTDEDPRLGQNVWLIIDKLHLSQFLASEGFPIVKHGMHLATQRISK